MHPVWFYVIFILWSGLSIFTTDAFALPDSRELKIMRNAQGLHWAPRLTTMAEFVMCGEFQQPPDMNQPSPFFVLSVQGYRIHYSQNIFDMEYCLLDNPIITFLSKFQKIFRLTTLSLLEANLWFDSQCADRGLMNGTYDET